MSNQASFAERGELRARWAIPSHIRRATWLLLWLSVWWSAVAISGVSSDFLPSPLQVAKQLIWLSQADHEIGEGTLSIHIAWSVLRFLSGFLLACAAGVPLGFLMGQFRFVDALISPLFRMLRNVPPIAWAPFSLLWFGASFGSQTFVIFTAAFPPILMNAYRGINLADKGLLNAGRMLGAGSVTLLFRVALPASMTSVLAGARIGITNGWLALVGAEIIAGPGALTGLGFLVLVGQQNLQATFSIGAMVIIGIIGAVFDYALVLLERKMT